jgi:pseudooxynicotine oxidase
MSEQHCNRRRFLQGVAGGTLALSGAQRTLAATQASPSATRNAYDVIVVGGGFAGITALRDLSGAGLRTLLLEARPRLGGRTFTSKFAGHDIDLGGTWIGLAQPFLWSERLRYGLPIAESAAFKAPQRAVYLSAGKRHETSPEAFGTLFAAGASRFMAPALEVFPRAFDPFYAQAYQRYDRLSSAEALALLRLPQPQHDIVSGFAAINGHTYLDRIGYLDQLKWYALGGYDALRLFENCARYRLEGGTRTLLDAMAKDAHGDIRTSAPVAAIVREGASYAVQTQDGESFGARAVIVAVPLNVLANIRFEPGISAAKLAASRERITGSGTKFYARLAGKQPVFSAQGPEKSPLTFLWTEYVDGDGQIVVGFGPSPDLLDIHDREAVQKAVSVYMPGAEVIETVGYDWNLDPYSQGTWCMYRPMFFSKYLRELQQPEGNIHFAGSDIANGWRGFIDGAIESGARSAQQVLRQLDA